MSERIGDVLRERPSWALWELADRLSVDVRYLERRMVQLMKEGKVERFDDNHRFKWRIK